MYREFEARLAPSMRQPHLAGDKVFVDYSGKTLPIRDPATGAVRSAQLFIAVLGASNYTYAEATWTQTLPDWIGAHVRMFEDLGGCPRLIVPDNLKSGVLKASFYDPELNRSYAHMAHAYSVGILPARPRRPRDKAKVEAGYASPSTSSSAGCAICRSSPWPRPMARSTGCWRTLTHGPSAASGSAARSCSNSSIGRRCGRCPTRPTNTRSGSSCVSAPTTMSRSPASTTRYRRH
ncbi:transposase [Azospirillum sp. Sh1]|nr:transposase [Azospirillum sp. Sh1]